jgi:hypothetical protein
MQTRRNVDAKPSIYTNSLNFSQIFNEFQNFEKKPVAHQVVIKLEYYTNKKKTMSITNLKFKILCNYKKKLFIVPRERNQYFNFNI